MKIDLREFRAAFVAEAEEHVSAVKSLLMQAEPSAQQTKAVPRELREMLRLVHTVKGLAAMVGVEPLVALAHKMETALRGAERAGGLLDERAVDVLLGAARAMDARVRAVGEDRPVPALPPDLLHALESLEPAAPASSTPLPLDPEILAKLGSSEQSQLREGTRAGRRAVRVDFAPTPEKVAADLTITTVRDRLSGIAEIVKVLPLMGPATDATPGGLRFALLVLTDATDEAIAEATGVSREDVSTLFAAPDPSAFAPPSAEDDDATAEGGRGVLRVEVTRVDEAIDMLGGLVVTQSRLTRALERLQDSGADTRELRLVAAENARQLRELRAAILRVRMIPMAVVLERLPLVIRGLGQASGKQVRVHLDVGAAELDKTVAESLFPALMHLVRNAVDHGVESPAERVAAGKRELATVAIRSVTRDRYVELRLSDDGRGVDRAAVAARAGGRVPTTDAELLELLCRPGLSTREQADATSGRGLGMDIVRKIVVNRLGGELALETHAGVGTTFVLRVPLTVAIVDAFTILCGSERYAVPVPSVEEVVDLAEARIVSPQGDRGMRLLGRRGDTVPLFDLAEALAIGVETGAAPHALLVRRSHGEQVAFAIARVVGQQEIVVRPLLDPLIASPAVSGATDLGDGRATVVLDLLALSSLMRATRRNEHAA